MKNNKPMWMVRAGEGGYLFNEFKSKNVVAIGWNKVGDLSKITKLSEIKQIIKERYPDSKKRTCDTYAAEINKFRSVFEKGDYVITYDPKERIYLVGEIIGNYEYNTTLLSDERYNNIRKVTWIERFSRDKISASTKNTLGAISAIFKVNTEVKREIIEILEGKKEKIEDVETEKETLDEIEKDIAEKAKEFTKDKISALDWEEMQELVAGVLRGMGYQTIITKKGPGIGWDIKASPDGLGLEEPRIIVEVKHQSISIGASEIRSFIGGLREKDKGLYVSKGGFSREAHYEAERANNPVTLIDLDMLAELITKYYDNLDAETRSLIPLKKIYWPT